MSDQHRRQTRRGKRFSPWSIDINDCIKVSGDLDIPSLFEKAVKKAESMTAQSGTFDDDALDTLHSVDDGPFDLPNELDDADCTPSMVEIQENVGCTLRLQDSVREPTMSPSMLLDIGQVAHLVFSEFPDTPAYKMGDKTTSEGWGGVEDDAVRLLQSETYVGTL